MSEEVKNKTAQEENVSKEADSLQKKSKRKKSKRRILFKLGFIAFVFAFFYGVLFYAEYSGRADIPFITLPSFLVSGKTTSKEAPEDLEAEASMPTAETVGTIENSDPDSVVPDAEAASDAEKIGWDDESQANKQTLADEDIFRALENSATDDAIFKALENNTEVPVASDKPEMETKDIRTPIKKDGTYVFIATWENDIEPEISLVTPEGLEISKDNITKYGNYYKEGKRVQYIIKNVKAGEWSVRVTKEKAKKIGTVEVQAQQIKGIPKIYQFRGLEYNNKVYFVWTIEGIDDQRVLAKIYAEKIQNGKPSGQKILVISKESALKDKDYFVTSALDRGQYQFTLVIEDSHGVRTSKTLRLDITKEK